MANDTHNTLRVPDDTLHQGLAVPTASWYDGLKHNLIKAGKAALVGGVALGAVGCGPSAPVLAEKAPATASAPANLDTPRTSTTETTTPTPDKFGLKARLAELNAMTEEEFAVQPKADQLAYAYYATRDFSMPATNKLGYGYSQLPQYDLFNTSKESTPEQVVIDSLLDIFNAAGTAITDSGPVDNELGAKILDSVFLNTKPGDKNNQSTLYIDLKEIVETRTNVKYMTALGTATGKAISKQGIAIVDNSPQTVSYRDIPITIGGNGRDAGDSATARLVLVNFKTLDGIRSAYVVDVISESTLNDLPTTSSSK